MNSRTCRNRYRSDQALILAWAVVVWLSLNGTLRSENWPQWRGPSGTGVSSERDIPLVWSETRSLLWKCELPAIGSSTPIVWRDAVFVTGITKPGQRVLLRIDGTTGKIIWQREVGQLETVEASPPKVRGKLGLPDLPEPSPVTDGKYVIAPFANGDLAACDFDGNLLWQINLQELYGKYNPRTIHASSPVLFKNYVISTCIQAADTTVGEAASYLVAHDVFSGRERWRTERITRAVGEQADAATTPLLIDVGEQRQLIVMGANQLDGYDPASGKQIWYLPNLTGGQTVSGPTFAQGTLFATRGERGATFGVKVSAEFAGEILRRNIIWERADSSPDHCSPVAWGELLFTVTDDGFGRCLHLPSGHTRWKHRLPGKYRASPIIIEGRVYLQNTEGLCTIVSAAPYYDKLVENQLADEFYASPAVSNGTLYLRGQERLYAIRK